jgi:hypothetical protein
MFNRLRFTPARRCTVERSEHTAYPGGADEAVSEADGVGGGQTAPSKARVKVGAGGTAIARKKKPWRAARRRGGVPDKVAACKPQAGERGLSLASAVVQRRRGRSSSGERRH